MNNYAMFTDAGNQAIDGLVTAARALELEWPAVYFALQVLSRRPDYAEATDTAVREAVYDACGFETDFYI